MIRPIIEVVLLTLIGYALGHGAMWVALQIAPLEGLANEQYITIGIGAIFVMMGLGYLRRRWGIGDYSEPDDQLPNTSTIEKALQQQKLDRWNNGERFE